MQDNEEAGAEIGRDQLAWNAMQEESAGKRKKKRKRMDAPTGTLSMNSLMDILVIMLVFLLKNFGDEPIKAVGADLKVPTSSTQILAEDMTSVTISRKAILVNDTLAVDHQDGIVDQSQKRGGERGMVIQPLFDELTKQIAEKKRQSAMMQKDYEPVVTIVVDQTIPYRLITEVMYTAGQAELSQFKFAIIRSDMKTFGGLK